MQENSLQEQEKVCKAFKEYIPQLYLLYQSFNLRIILFFSLYLTWHSNVTYKSKAKTNNDNTELFQEKHSPEVSYSTKTVLNQIEKKFFFVFTVISTLWKKCLIYGLFEIIHHSLLISVALTSCAVTSFNFKSISIQYIIFLQNL